METQLTVIDDAFESGLLFQYLKEFDYVAFDTETTGVSKRDKIIGFSVCAEETLSFYVIINSSTEENALSILNLLKEKQLICHNAIFDCMMVESNFKVSLINSVHSDTMILAHLLNENRRVGLKELAKEYFGEDSTKEQEEMKASILANGGKITKKEYELYKADPYLIGKYGAKDALLTYKLFTMLVPELYEQGLDKFFYEDESMPLLRGATYDLNTVGLQVDTKKLTNLKKQLEAECLEAKAFIYQEIQPLVQEKYPGTKKKDVFNIGSSSQLAWLLFGVMKLEFNTLTKKGKTVCKSLGERLPYTYKAKRDFIDIALQDDSIKNVWSLIACDKVTLKKLAPKHEWIQKLLEYQRKTKILNTYVEGIEERVQYGIIQPSFLQHGTTSGRYSSRNPNWQNLPREEQRIKECIIARPGRVFVSADYSQLEPRVFAYYSRDVRLMSAFDGTADFYSVVGASVFNKTDCTLQKEGSPDAFGVKYKHLRNLAKIIALARAYGATAYQLAPTTGKSIDDTQQDMDNYDKAFPGVLKMMLEAHNLAKKQGYVENAFGRRRRIPEAMHINKLYGDIEHKELPYEARGLLNLACNHRIQSTGASICNRAMIAFVNLAKELELDAKIVSQVHDEIIIEAAENDAESVSLLLQHCMENTTILEGVALEAVPRITRNLAK